MLSSSNAHGVWGPGTVPRAGPGHNAPGHLRRCAGLVDEDQPFRFQIRLKLKPGLPSQQNISPLLFAGVRGFF